MNNYCVYNNLFWINHLDGPVVENKTAKFCSSQNVQINNFIYFLIVIHYFYRIIFGANWTITCINFKKKNYISS